MHSFLAQFPTTLTFVSSSEFLFFHGLSFLFVPFTLCLKDNVTKYLAKKIALLFSQSDLLFFSFFYHLTN